MYLIILHQGLKILAFPCNQFMSQESGSNEAIKCFISGYKGDGKLDIFSKVNVNGDDAHPLWKFLKEKQGGTLIEYYFTFQRSESSFYNSHLTVIIVQLNGTLQSSSLIRKGNQLKEHLQILILWYVIEKVLFEIFLFY